MRKTTISFGGRPLHTLECGKWPLLHYSSRSTLLVKLNKWHPFLMAYVVATDIGIRRCNWYRYTVYVSFRYTVVKGATPKRWRFLFMVTKQYIGGSDRHRSFPGGIEVTISRDVPGWWNFNLCWEFSPQNLENSHFGRSHIFFIWLGEKTTNQFTLQGTNIFPKKMAFWRWFSFFQGGMC